MREMAIQRGLAKKNDRGEFELTALGRQWLALPRDER